MHHTELETNSSKNNHVLRMGQVNNEPQIQIHILKYAQLATGLCEIPRSNTYAV